jgi:hypothetical protein
MPDPYERHSRNRWEWGSPPGRSEMNRDAAQDDPARAHTPGKKDKDLCKTAHWRGPHQPELRMMLNPFNLKKRECGWGARGWISEEEIHWYCYHDEICTGCGKVLRSFINKEECPGYHEITAEETAACEAERQRRREFRVSYQIRKPIITGPQGYRKPKRKTLT